MVIRALDYVDHCVTNQDGVVIFNTIKPIFDRGDKVCVSFDGVQSLPSSFVNTAFVPLLNHFSYDQIKRVLSFVHTNPQMNRMIKDRFDFEENRLLEHA